MTSRNMVTCVYVSDDGKSYLARADTRYQSQNTGGDTPTPLFGHEVATSDQLDTLPNVPRDLKMRHVIVSTADGAFFGRINCFTNAAYIALNADSTLNFYDGHGAEHAGKVRGHEGEHSMHKRDIS